MTRTNIEIDEALVLEVMGRYRLESKRSAVDFALRNLVALPLTRDEILAMRGTGIEFENEELENEEIENEEIENGWTAA